MLDALIAHAEAADITGKRDAMLDGVPINTSEDRAVLHARLRDPHATMAQENVERMVAGLKECWPQGSKMWSASASVVRPLAQKWCWRH